MIRPKLCFAAEGVVRDVDLNTISAYNIMEGFVAVSYPLLMQRAVFFVLWEREANDPQQANGRFRFLLDNDELIASELRIDFQNNPRTRSVVRINGMVVPQAGLLHFRIDLEGDIHAEYVVEAQIVPPVAENQPAGARPVQ
jgi:hypothetical protein